jgi:hypothetical protein
MPSRGVRAFSMPVARSLGSQPSRARPAAMCPAPVI